MTTEERIRRLKTDGFCVIERVIPDDQVDQVRQSVVEAQARRHAEAEAELAATRARGHRVGVMGVANLRQVINQTQAFAPYLADRRILDLAEAFFGPWVRISCTDCVINNPGNGRGYLHADWPYNRTNASHVRAPYPDVMMHISTIWMLSPFSAETGGTLVVPGSHRTSSNPAGGGNSVPEDDPYPTEMNVCGPAGSVFVSDSRLWHAVAPNRSREPRVAILIRYAPWWLNLNPTMIGTPEHTAMVVETGGKNYELPPVRKSVYESLPEDVKPLYRFWVK